MARIASQAKAGFYPTPDRVCSLLKEKLQFEANVRILDPCCGEGKTLEALTGGQAETFGVELDHNRATEARKRLNRVLWGDAITEITITPGSFSALYLNPPYDDAAVQETVGKSERMEVQFLKRYLGLLQPEGLLILVIPWRVLRHCSRLLSRYFEIEEILAFPEKEYQTFKQCLFLGRKRRLKPEKEARLIEHRLKILAELPSEVFRQKVTSLEDYSGLLEVSESRNTLVNFKARNCDPLEAVPKIRKSGVLENLLQEIVPAENREIRPLLPLENGHLALILAGGFMNGAVEKDGKQLVIKGTVTKTETVVDSNEDSTTTKDQYVPTLKVIDMQTAEMFIVQ